MDRKGDAYRFKSPSIPTLAKAYSHLDDNKAGEVWAIALSEDGQYLASTSIDGRINVWNNFVNRSKIREFETKGSFGMSIDLVFMLNSKL